ncbi:MAG: peptide antibiotic transporter SbmA [Pseudomonadota bacterium]
MFESFFPRPKIFALSFVGWSVVTLLIWYFALRGAGGALSLGWIFGLTFPETLPPDADEAAQAAFEAARSTPQTFWLYQYVITCYVIFTLVWMRLADTKWAAWSVAGSALIIFTTWFQVQIDVFVNFWYRDFYDLVQRALAEPNAVELSELNGQILTVFAVLVPAIILAVLKLFFTSHYVFRWRTAMNERYTAIWPKIRHIEGASQRIQDDTMRFARIVETLGVNIIDSFMTLIAFLPILWGLSVYVSEIPILGQIPQALVVLAILWSVFGTGLIALAGYRLPGLEFRNQRVEASYRKELVIGEDDELRAQPPTLGELFGFVRKNYFRLYLEYTYFNVVRFTYLQTGNIVPLFALGPTIVAGAITFGLFQQIINAFNRVENSFQFLINAWPTIIELMSIQKRLAAFELAIRDQELADIEFEGETRAV